MSGCPHNDEYECAACTDALHDLIHPVLVEGCMACKVSTIQIGEKVLSRKTGGAPAGNANSWEAGIARDHRGVPFLAGDVPIGMKQYQNNRSVYEAERRRLQNAGEI